MAGKVAAQLKRIKSNLIEVYPTEFHIKGFQAWRTIA